MKTKFILLFLGLLTFVISCNKDKDIAFDSKSESIVPFEIRNIKSEVDEYFKNNPDLFPDKIKPIIMWEKAVRVKNDIEVEVKLTDNLGKILVPGARNPEDKEFHGKYILKINVNDLKNMYIFAVIPESKAFFVYNDVILKSLHNPAFSGLVLISKINLKPFATLKYENGKVIARSKNNMSNGDRRNNNKIDSRYLYCWTTYTQWDMYSGRGEYLYSDIQNVQTHCIWIDEGEEGYNGSVGNNGVGNNDDSDWCDLYPWLCEDGGGGGSDGDGGDEDNSRDCTCLNPYYGFDLCKFEVWVKVVNQDLVHFGYFSYNLKVSNTNCKTGTYSSTIHPIHDCGNIEVRDDYDTIPLDKSQQYKNNNGKMVPCEYWIRASWWVSADIAWHAPLGTYTFYDHYNDSGVVSFLID